MGLTRVRLIGLNDARVRQDCTWGLTSPEGAEVELIFGLEGQCWVEEEILAGVPDCTLEDKGGGGHGDGDMLAPSVVEEGDGETLVPGMVEFGESHCHDMPIAPSEESSHHEAAEVSTSTDELTGSRCHDDVEAPWSSGWQQEASGGHPEHELLPPVSLSVSGGPVELTSEASPPTGNISDDQCDDSDEDLASVLEQLTCQVERDTKVSPIAPGMSCCQLEEEGIPKFEQASLCWIEEWEKDGPAAPSEESGTQRYPASLSLKELSWVLDVKGVISTSMLELETSEEKWFEEHEWKLSVESNLLLEELGQWSKETGNAAVGIPSWLELPEPPGKASSFCEVMRGKEEQLVDDEGSADVLAIEDDDDDDDDENGDDTTTEGGTDEGDIAEKSELPCWGISRESSDEDGNEEAGDGGGVGDDGLFMMAA